MKYKSIVKYKSVVQYIKPCITRCLLASFFSLSIVAIGIAQTSLTLSQAVEKGLQNSLDIRRSQINTAIADKQLKAAKKERLPSIDVFAQQGNNILNDRSPTSFINDFYRDRNLSLGIDGEWLVFDGFQGKTNQQRYKLTKEERDIMEQLTIDNSIYAILQAYYEALIKSEALEVAKQSKDLSEERVKDAQLKENLGQASRYDALRFENALLLDATNVLQKEGALATAIIQLNSAMGNAKTVDYQLASPLDYETQQYDLATLKRTMEQQNKELLSQNLAVEIMRLNTKAIKNSSLPNLSVNTGLSQRFNGTRFPEVPRIKSNTFQFYLRFSASYNLYDGGRRKQAAEENELLEQIELVTIDQLKTSLQQELSNRIQGYENQVDILKVTNQLLENLELNMQLEKERYNSGFSSALDFRTVQLEYINTQFEKLEAIYQLILNEITILSLTGTLNKNWRNK